MISAALIILFINFLQLSEVAAAGSITVLIVHLAVHIGHLRLHRQTRTSLTLLGLAILATATTIGFALVYLSAASPMIL